MSSVIIDGKLKQKQGYDRRTFEITSEGLIKEYKDQGEYSKFEVPYEDIGFKELVTSSRPNGVKTGLFLSVFLNVLMICVIILSNFEYNTLGPSVVNGLMVGIITGFVVWAVIVFKEEYFKHLRGGTTISFFYHKKEKKIVDQFIEDLRVAKRRYLRNKYFKINNYTAIDVQKNTFLWLLQNDLITESEFEVIIEDLENSRIINGR